MESIRKKEIQSFFKEYALTFNAALKGNFDVERTTGFFANYFVAVNPLDIACGKNDSEFKKAISQGYTFYTTIGIISMNIIFNEISILDELHAIAKVRWRSHFNRKDGSVGHIDFTNFYFVQTRENKTKIFGYITGDEQAALRTYGLI